MEERIIQALHQATDDLKSPVDSIELEQTEEQYGDFSTNLAMKLAKKDGANPKELAAQICSLLSKHLTNYADKIEVAGPGFINIRLKDSVLINELYSEPRKLLDNKVIVTEYSDPNPFKILHAGHLYTSVVGDAISNILESAGAKVHRVNFGGDVGLHVAKSLWAILKEIGEDPSKLDAIEKNKRSEWLSKAYVNGNKAYDDSEQAKAEIVELNKKVYKIHEDNDHDSPLAQIYWTTREWSYEHFKQFYESINISFEKYYPESQTAPIGIKIVMEQLEKGVYEKSDGAIIFPGEKYGLHTRVFINKDGLPTYETKDIGLIYLKKQDYNFDQSIVITANEQEQYMAVVLKSLEQFDPDLANATNHLTHGVVRLSDGKKMSSREGNVLTADDVLQAAKLAAQKISDKVQNNVVLAAVKYSFLKQRTGGDIVYIPEESVNILGNSGPYLQYSHARAMNILNKSSNEVEHLNTEQLQGDERTLVRKLAFYNSILNKATLEFSPHLICTYLYELAQVFNNFYEHNRVIDDERQSLRLAIVKSFAERLSVGLSLLGIEAPDSI